MHSRRGTGMTHPDVHPQTPRVAVASGCVLGEAPLWDDRTGTLLWVDTKAPAVWRYKPETDEFTNLPVTERVGFVVLTEDPDVLIAGFKSGLARLRLSIGETDPIGTPEPDKPGNRLNDGCVGPNGHLYFGTMDDAEKEPTGSFYRWDGQSFARFGTSTKVTNGPALSPDGRIVYATHTPERTIFAHSLDADG